MSNRENTPTPFVLQGDVESLAGSPNLTVQGFQNTPVAPTKPNDGQVYVYVASINQWVPADPIVSGPNAVGTNPTANPVQTGGIDEGNLVRESRLDTYGGIRSINIEELLLKILLELRAVKFAIMNLDNTTISSDYLADQYQDNFIER